MLVLSRKSKEQIVIGADIVLTVVAVKGNRVSIGIEAPPAVRIQRSELNEGHALGREPSAPVPACASPIGSDMTPACAASPN